LSENRVLIVDDEPQILSLFSDALARHGYDTLTARDANTAIEHMTQRGPRVAFLDPINSITPCSVR
jgi:DNA-binding NtrC family response regulator